MMIWTDEKSVFLASSDASVIANIAGICPYALMRSFSIVFRTSFGSNCSLNTIVPPETST
jgi:hypothetical protein